MPGESAWPTSYNHRCISLIHFQFIIIVTVLAATIPPLNFIFILIYLGFINICHATLPSIVPSTVLILQHFLVLV